MSESGSLNPLFIAAAFLLMDMISAGIFFFVLQRSESPRACD